ncbi:hypothetical protein BCV71DRAFT_266782 [Rhizopus microsporus]|uniref:Uncharacterized protein n=1 Tax=Rhizopus microsporus TaxID=58291 RepID=A0A1X0RTH5_RHIZD|nr:hypothetical protein BCV71DRAFT_266782 [Rhizopus microsporus]
MPLIHSPGHSLTISKRLFRSIDQVYTAPSHCKQIGDWGLKRSLPTVIRTPYLTVQQLDTAEHQTPWRSGNSQVLFIKRWKENFPNSKKPAPRSDQDKYNIVKMTPAEFKRFLQQCAKRAPEFRQLLEQKKVVPEQVFDYLQVAFKDSPGDAVVGPLYSDYQQAEPVIVQGRILNAAKRNGHVVGVGGITALLPKRHTVYMRQLGDRRVRTFYVEEASIDEEGRPRVILSAAPKDAHAHAITIEEVDETAKEMFLTSRPPAQKIMSDDHIEANPNHDLIMRRIINLMGNAENDNKD